MTHLTREQLLDLPMEELLKHCRFEAFRGVGPGGQKRNKTSSAARVTLEDYSISAFDDTSRSQHLNKEFALQKLRMQIAFSLRCEPAVWNSPIPGLNSVNWAKWVACAFDALEQTGYKLSDAAQLLGMSTAQLSKTLGKDPAVWQTVNQQRIKAGLTQLRQ